LRSTALLSGIVLQPGMLRAVLLDRLTRSLESQAADPRDGTRSEALRLRGPANETIRMEAELDATDGLETGDENAVNVGLHPQIAALEALLQPTSEQLRETDASSVHSTRSSIRPSARSRRLRGGFSESVLYLGTKQVQPWARRRVDVPGVVIHGEQGRAE